jgi:hypothetical protein
LSGLLYLRCRLTEEPFGKPRTGSKSELAIFIQPRIETPLLGNMDLLESSTHSFIIKVWLEGGATDGGRAGWHGHITHVPGGQRRYLKDLSEITAFIKPFLNETGFKPGLRFRVRRWIDRWKS